MRALSAALSAAVVVALVLAGCSAPTATRDDAVRTAGADASASPRNPPLTAPPTALPPGPPAEDPWLAGHPVLQDPSLGLQQVSCDLPRWSADPASAAAYFRAAEPCVRAAWEPLMKAHRRALPAPQLAFPEGESWSTPCGDWKTDRAGASYCPSTRTIYLPFAGLSADRYGDDAAPHLALFAHEYGHYIQHLLRILDEVHHQQVMGYLREKKEMTELSVRMELQAQCFSGLFFGAAFGRGSVTAAFFQSAWDDQARRGDDAFGDQVHGSNAHFAQWWRAGAGENRIAACNTFAAPADEVS